MTDTSREAHESIRPKITDIQRIVLRLHVDAGFLGLNQTELEKAASRKGFRVTTSTIRTRRSELEKMGLLLRTTNKRRTVSGRSSYVFIATSDLQVSIDQICIS